MTATILIVEDNPVSSAFLTRVLTESFQDIAAIKTASDARAARKLLELDKNADKLASPFQLILIDLDLPDGSALALLRELRNYPAMRIVTTHYADDEPLLPALQTGAAGYLLKEDRFEVLVEALQRIVQQQPSLAPALARQVLQFLQANQTLSAIETDVLTHLSKGLSSKEVARQLGIKWLDVYGHIRAVYGKLHSNAGQTQSDH